MKYYVIDTDYKNYAIGFGCAYVPYNGKVEVTWVYGRETTLSDEYVNKIKNTLFFKHGNLRRISQKDCENKVFFD